MSESVNAPRKPDPARATPADRSAFAQVEKWLDLIREICRERGKG
jgi:hypothetical protein